jgi:hypothetical protein
MGDGFRRKVDERIEGAATAWLDLVQQKKDLQEQIDVAAEHVLSRMRAAKVTVYECSDGTVLTLEESAKVKGKRPKRTRTDDDEPRRGAAN